ncbi:MarR family winged helix-turn-helix transcriptional regulator [Rhizobiaceae bacterium]|nr:MarR family winged helix-turn-helix transcriptional regulator [Rhizobiaceae bacterium]
MKTGQALHLWHGTMLGLARDDEPDLGPRQMAILLTVYLDTPPHTVRGLAASLKVTKPVITRALNTMGNLGLLTRRRDERDGRNVLIQRTVAGAEYLEALGARTASVARSVA